MEGQGWPFLQTFNKKRDGRAAFKALKSQAEGKSAIATRKAKAYNMLATATYTGKGKFSFDQFSGWDRDPKLETAIQGCMGDELKLTNFEVCQQYFKTIVENTKTRTKSPSDVREISKVGVEKDKKKAKHKKDKSKSNDDDKTPSGIAIHSGQYSAKDYNKLKPFEKAKVKQLREEAKKKEKKDKSDARSVAVVATQEEAPPDDNEGTKTPVVSNAGKQFGRAAHGRNTLLVSDEGRQVTVHPYSGEYKPIPDVSIATVATLWIHPTDGQPYILIINEALYFGDRVDVTLLNPNQLRANGVTVEDVPRQFDSKSSHSIYHPTAKLRIPLSLDGISSGFFAKKEETYVSSVSVAETLLATDHVRNASRLVSAVKSLSSMNAPIGLEDDSLGNRLVAAINVAVDDIVGDGLSGRTDNDVYPMDGESRKLFSLSTSEKRSALTPEILSRRWELALTLPREHCK
ncbi:hypothetical protein MHU86_21046 [Fragilaria crotonensis]|nr:hypothetical protein MHU86_21046 [Fragilaria crotonensis]